MNGIHDMGGMQGLGALGYEENEPAFHEPWEGRVLALIRAAPSGFSRTYIEGIHAADYLRMSYYERWYTAFVTKLIDSGVVTRAELESGRAHPAAPRATPSMTPEMVHDLIFNPPKSEQDIELTPRFNVGDRVRGRNLNPTTHTRMPRYTRGRTGVVARDRGVFNLPDSQEALGDPRPQHVYLIRFTARELWGEKAPAHDSLGIDMWEDYLEPA